MENNEQDYMIYDQNEIKVRRLLRDKRRRGLTKKIKDDDEYYHMMMDSR